MNPANLEDFNVIYQTQMILMFEWVEKLDEFRNIINVNDKVFNLIFISF